ncbi:hypothetical protein G3578_03230 [Brevibacillus sp. SYP-B805]|uniref:hypothetical protein n=1 Tax=Brevibacillus sp. SYP-B805 TaxID=1578199 RepID=UPI0013EDE559|nr:hypothetical protein [Brevibacillus sp. SYP-B805]NGQ94187.1 hypothetical protein [Brevibacillus sp. SYP-B805]
MKRWLNVFLAFAMILGFGMANAPAGAASPSDNKLEIDFRSPIDNLAVGKKIKLEVYTTNIGKLIEPGTFKFLSSAAEKVENVKTTLSSNKKYYITTGYYTPKAEGKHILLFGIKVRDNSGTDRTGATMRVVNVIDPNKLSLNVASNDTTVTLGEYVTVTLTYTVNSKYSYKLEYSNKVKLVKSTVKNGVYTRTVKFKPEKTGTYRFTVTLSQSKTGKKITKGITYTVVNKQGNNP